MTCSSTWMGREERFIMDGKEIGFIMMDKPNHWTGVYTKMAYDM